TVSTEVQEIVLGGSGFEPGSSVNLSYPNGDGGVTITPDLVSTVNAPGQIEAITATTLRLRARLNSAGRWGVKVINSAGQSVLKLFTVHEQPEAKTPLILIPGIAGSQLDAINS